MDPATATLIGAGVNLVGGLFSQSSARSAYQHRYQDTVQDMRKAGLNPALAYGQNPGGGAQVHDFGDIGTQAVTASQAAAQARKTKAETDLLNAQRDDIVFMRHQNALASEWNRNSAMWNAMSNEARKDMIMRANSMGRELYQSDLDAALAANKGTQTAAELARLQLPEARAAAKYYTGAGRFQPYVNGAKDLASIYQMLRGKPSINYNFGRYR